MISTQTDSISELPLSWARTSTANPVLNVVRLPYSTPIWIPTAEIPHHYSFDQLYREHLSRLPNGFVLQSCSLPLRDYLIEQGCQVAAMGAEAILDYMDARRITICLQNHDRKFAMNYEKYLL